ncbi:MAG: hypothetical protein OCU16_06100 [Candidatus Methanospirare jalkutatii]|nr:hypothetical protein [Candidatus Methanospirare jalkutatii]
MLSWQRLHDRREIYSGRGGGSGAGALGKSTRRKMRTFCGSDRDYGNSVQQTSDSKYISLASQGLTVLATIMMPKDGIKNQKLFKIRNYANA